MPQCKLSAWQLVECMPQCKLTAQQEVESTSERTAERHTRSGRLQISECVAESEQRPCQHCMRLMQPCTASHQGHAQTLKHAVSSVRGISLERKTQSLLWSTHTDPVQVSLCRKCVHFPSSYAEHLLGLHYHQCGAAIRERARVSVCSSCRAPLRPAAALGLMAAAEGLGLHRHTVVYWLRVT
eukprot:1136670-Pelagomonas_calceolata.AAC.9